MSARARRVRVPRVGQLTAAAVRRSTARWAVLAGTAAAAGLELLPGLPVPLLVVAGCWLLLGAPLLLWYGFADRFVSTRDGRALVAVALAVGTDLVGELALNTALPLLGDDRPLRQAPLTLGAALTVLLLAWVLPEPSGAVAGPGVVKPGVANSGVTGPRAAERSAAGRTAAAAPASRACAPWRCWAAAACCSAWRARSG